MQTADLITSFLSNEMSAEQERQFLLSVAASDSLRLGLKSHVMVDKIFQKQLAEATVPGDVRAKIFDEMNASLGPVGVQSAPSAAAPSADPMARISAQRGFLQLLVAKIGTGVIAASLMVGGFAAGYLTHGELNGGRAPQAQVNLIPNTLRDEHPSLSAPAPSSNVLRQSAAGDAELSPSAEQRTREQSDIPPVRTVRGKNAGHIVSAPAMQESAPSGADHGAGSPSAGGVIDHSSAPREVSETDSRPATNVSVNVKIAKPAPEDRQKAKKAEDQGMP